MQPLNAKQIANNQEWWSKLTDSVLSPVLMILLWLTIAMVVRPIERQFGLPGLLIYVLGLLAVSMFSLQQSIDTQNSDIVRMWYGIASGFLAWGVVEVSNDLGIPVLPNLAGIILLIMVSLIVALLWRYGLPTGAKFFFLTFLLNWTELVLMRVEEGLAKYSPIFTLIYRATFVLAGFGVALILGWLLFHSRERSQRVIGALSIWFLISLTLYAVRIGFF